MSLKPRQHQLLAAIARHLEHHGRPPTWRELAAALGYRASSAVGYQIKRLIAHGLIRTTASASRGLELTPAGSALLGRSTTGAGLPLLGRVPAGSPLEAIEQADVQLAQLRELYPEADYLLQIQGDSMKEAGILDGDLIAVKRVETARHGDIVVARVNNEDTVKRLYHRNGKVLLVPENSALQPIEVDPARDEFAIDGVYVGLLRVGGKG